MSKHALVRTPDRVQCRQGSGNRELTVATEGREVALRLAGERVWLDIRGADRLAHLLLVAADAVTHRCGDDR